MSRPRILRIGLVAIVLAVIAGVVAYDKAKTERWAELASQPDSVFNRASSPRYGPDTARIRIVKFFDPACEICRIYHPLLKGIVDGSQGRVQLLIKYAPFQQDSETAVKILEAARLQGQFWPVAEALLKSQQEWVPSDRLKPDHMWSHLGTGALNRRAAQDAMNTPTVGRRIEQDLADAKELNVTGAPVFFVNGRRPRHFGYSELKTLVDEQVGALYARP